MTQNPNAALEALPKPPLAGESMSGADIILRVLSEEGVDTVCGYSGGAILPTYDAVFRFNEEREEDPASQIKLVVPANEPAAGFTAARPRRGPGEGGLCLGTTRPRRTHGAPPA